eukprot:1160797-Pelagomonas_calceolata.AAC.9
MVDMAAAFCVCPLFPALDFTEQVWARRGWWQEGLLALDNALRGAMLLRGLDVRVPGVEKWIVLMVVFHQGVSGMSHAKSVSQVVLIKTESCCSVPDSKNL